jgi:hypothetical protein
MATRNFFAHCDLDSDRVADSFNNGPYFHYWTQNFGRRNNVYPMVINREA